MNETLVAKKDIKDTAHPFLFSFLFCCLHLLFAVFVLHLCTLLIHSLFFSSIVKCRGTRSFALLFTSLKEFLIHKRFGVHRLYPNLFCRPLENNLL